MATPLLTVTANDIDAAGLAIDAELPLAWLADELAEGKLTGVAPGHITARLSRSGKESIVVRGKVKAELVTPCARCLDPSRVSVDTEITLLLQPAPVAKVVKLDARANGKAHGKAPAKDDDEYEFTAEEAEVDHYDGEAVVLDPFVREAILLEVPNFPLCSEDCPGIRPAAPVSTSEEAEPPIDPRLAPLAALREKLGLAGIVDVGGAPAPPNAPSKKKNKE